MRRKKAWKRGLLGVAAVLAVYLFMTPMLDLYMVCALRLGVALSGHPKEAICLRAQTAEEFGYHDDTGLQSTLYCIGESVPYFELTGTPGQNWEVRQIGPFRYAVYYGWA